MKVLFLAITESSQLQERNSGTLYDGRHTDDREENNYAYSDMSDTEK